MDAEVAVAVRAGDDDDDADGVDADADEGGDDRASEAMASFADAINDDVEVVVRGVAVTAPALDVLTVISVKASRCKTKDAMARRCCSNRLSPGRGSDELLPNPPLVEVLAVAPAVGVVVVVDEAAPFVVVDAEVEAEGSSRDDVEDDWMLPKLELRGVL